MSTPRRASMRGARARHWPAFRRLTSQLASRQRRSTGQGAPPRTGRRMALRLLVVLLDPPAQLRRTTWEVVEVAQPRVLARDGAPPLQTPGMLQKPLPRRRDGGCAPPQCLPQSRLPARARASPRAAGRAAARTRACLAPLRLASRVRRRTPSSWRVMSRTTARSARRPMAAIIASFGVQCLHYCWPTIYCWPTAVGQIYCWPKSWAWPVAN